MLKTGSTGPSHAEPCQPNKPKEKDRERSERKKSSTILTSADGTFKNLKSLNRKFCALRADDNFSVKP